MLAILAIVFPIWHGLLTPGSNTDKHVYMQTVHMEATILEDSDRVEIITLYTLQWPSAIQTLDVRGMTAFGTHLESIHVQFDSLKTALPFEQGMLDFHGSIDRTYAQHDTSECLLKLIYTFSNARKLQEDRFDVTLPVIWFEQGTFDPHKQLLHADVTLPSQYYLEESYPVTQQACAQGNAAPSHCFGLQVIPTFIRLQGKIGEQNFFTPMKVLDGAILMYLIGIGTLILIVIARKNTVVKQAL